jgi:hypothetical protein
LRTFVLGPLTQEKLLVQSITNTSTHTKELLL